MHVVHSDQRSRLIGETCRAASRFSPRFLVTAVLHVALDLNSPVLDRLVGIAQAAERDSDLDLVTPRRDVALGLPEEVRAQVYLSRPDVGPGYEAAGLVRGAVGLDTQRIDGEYERAVAFVIGVKTNLDVVTRADVVTISECGAHRAVWLVCANAEVDRGSRVPDVHVSRIRRGA